LYLKVHGKKKAFEGGSSSTKTKMRLKDNKSSNGFKKNGP